MTLNLTQKMDKDYEIFINCRTDTIYISPGFPKRKFPKEMSFEEFEKKYEELVKDEKLIVDHRRIASKHQNTKDDFYFIKNNKEIVLRRSGGGKQAIIAKFLESNKDIYVLTFQRYTSATGIPHKAYFSFTNDEIVALKEFIDSIPYVQLKSKSSQKIKESEIKKIIQTTDFIKKNKELIKEIVQNDITPTDIALLNYRKKQVRIFEKMLNDEDYFEDLRNRMNIRGKEGVWQRFFEKNNWIFGYGLSYIFNSSLDDKKLEQVVTAHGFNEKGKRADGLLKTRGLINLICIAEIKHHKTELLYNKESYRVDCWRISEELSGAVSQIQKTVQKAIKKIDEETRIRDNNGNPTGEIVYTYQPKSFIIVGSLNEFQTENGVNREKLSSFELFRQNLVNPEIITFDELYERAKFIVEKEN